MHPSHFAKSTPDKPAFIMAGSGEVVTYLQLEQRSNQIAQLFRSLGLQPDDHIAIHMENQAHRSPGLLSALALSTQQSALTYVRRRLPTLSTTVKPKY